jgi:hypothetical protein
MKKKLLFFISLFTYATMYGQPHLSRNHYMGTGLPTPPSNSPTAYPFDVKNFSITPLASNSSAGSNVYASVGTAFQDSIVKGIFYYPFANNGASLDCIPPGGSSTVRARYLYDDSTYTDVRAVAVVSRLSSDNSDLVILSQVKDASKRHGLKLLFINHCSGAIIKDLVYFPPFSGQGIHPLDIVYNKANQTFYICGYIQSDSTATNRSAFVATYNESTLSFSMSNVMSWNSGISSPFDYDMAIHLKLLKKGINAGKLLVLGSNNIPVGGVNHSGSLAILMQLNTGIINKVSISDATPVASDYKDEYAYDAVEDSLGNNLFIYSNKFSPDITTEPGYHPKSRYTMITRTSANLVVHPTLNSRIKMKAWMPNVDGMWGKTLIANNVIAGYQAYEDSSSQCHLASSLPPSYQNILPFFAKVVPAWNLSTGLSAVINYWKLYYTQISTPTFYSLGGIESNISWPTKFATDDITLGATTDMMAVAPLWNGILPSITTPANKLSYKFIRTDNSGDMDFSSPYSCDNIYSNCAPRATSLLPKNYDSLSTFTAVGMSVNNFTGRRKLPQIIWVNDSLGCNLNGYYRPSGVAELSEVKDVKIYPNPAYDNLNIEFKTNSVSKVSIYIYDLTGKKIYSTVLNAINNGNNKTTIPMLSLIAGTYVVELRNGSEISRHLVTKQ